MAAFDDGAVSSDAGALLLGKSDEASGLIDRLTGWFIDERDANLIEHTLRTLIRQRVRARAKRQQVARREPGPGADFEDGGMSEEVHPFFCARQNFALSEA